MNVLVDTSVWSLALRRRAEDRSAKDKAVVEALHVAIEQGTARILGIVRQEILSGVKSDAQFEKLRETLDAFPDVEVEPEDYVEAARLGNVCRAKGVAASAVDMLLCAVVARRGWEIFTMDGDFERYEKRLGVRLHRGKW